MATNRMKVAIIGAGLAGLTAARALPTVYDVTLFEKSAGPGGRIATRHRHHAFDHGAQFFRARDPRFKELVKQLLTQGVIAPWHARFVESDAGQLTPCRTWHDKDPHYVAVATMNHLGQYLARGLPIKFNTKIENIQMHPLGWRLYDDQGLHQGDFDWVISTLPAAQAALLLPKDFTYHEHVQQVRMSACYALMLSFTPGALEALPFDAALIKNQDISWVSINSTKPQRQPGHFAVVHSTNRWANQHLTLAAEEVTAHLLKEVAHATPLPTDKISCTDLHLWRYANINKQHGPKALIDPQRRLIACGDWCIQGRIEAAYLSGLEAARCLSASSE